MSRLGGEQKYLITMESFTTKIVGPEFTSIYGQPTNGDPENPQPVDMSFQEYIRDFLKEKFGKIIYLKGLPSAPRLADEQDAEMVLFTMPDPTSAQKKVVEQLANAAGKMYGDVCPSLEEARALVASARQSE